MSDTDKDDIALEQLFSAARSQSPAADDDFMARLMADAETGAAAAVTTLASQEANPSRSGWLSKLTTAWLPASGLTAAMAIGIFVGASDTDLGVSSDFLLSDTDYLIEDFLPGSGFGEFDDTEISG